MNEFVRNVHLFIHFQVIVKMANGSIHEGTSSMVSEVGAVREILAQHGRLSVDVNRLDEESDLYACGLTSLATVGIMLALEDRFDIEFPESMLSRKTFKSVSAITEAVVDLAG